MKKMHKPGRRRGGVWGFHALSGPTTLQEPPCDQLSGRPEDPVLLGFCGSSIMLAWLIKSLTTDLATWPSALLTSSELGGESGT